ncbi:hypothetical protein BD408DRAFT_413181 [Parasitella parasitica]|nr:hypothetical protein BD408DRAFT_413181 [Parasitella parasitica]
MLDSSSSSCSSIEDFYQHSNSSNNSTDSEGFMYEYQQFPSLEEFNSIVNGYLQNLSSKKRDKALVDNHRYSLILQVLKDPRNTAISTAQFRFWVKKMFRLNTTDHMEFVCHDGKPVATREDIYNILIIAHKEAHHGGRDKTSALVRKRYSWIPKELIARFVRHCPFCISRRNGCQQTASANALMSKASLPIYTPPSPLCNSSMNSFLRRQHHLYPHRSSVSPKRKRHSPYSNHHYSSASISLAATVATSAAAAAVAASAFISTTPTPQDDAEFDFFYGQQHPSNNSSPNHHLYSNNDSTSYSYLLQQQQNGCGSNPVTTAASVATAAAMAAVKSNQQHQLPSSPTSITSDVSLQHPAFNATFQSAIAAASAITTNNNNDSKFFAEASPPPSSCSLSDDASSSSMDITNNIPSPASFSEHCQLLKQLIEE